jgi:predicted transcriptional regulator of viral defense system
MNTKSKKGLFQERFLKLAKLGISVFHTDDLANLWQISDRHNLHMTLKRYVDNGLLVRIYRGLYAIQPPDKIDPLLLGTKALHRFAYVSTETTLSIAGIIQQELIAYTFVSSVSHKFFLAGNRFVSRKLQDRFLYNEHGIYTEGGIKKATVPRAIADMLYFNPHAYFDAHRYIDWDAVRKMQKNLGYPLISKTVRK